MQEAREEEKKKKKQQNLFKGLKFFLNRETNIESLTFVIRACRGEVSRQGAGVYTRFLLCAGLHFLKILCYEKLYVYD